MLFLPFKVKLICLSVASELVAPLGTEYLFRKSGLALKQNLQLVVIFRMV